MELQSLISDLKAIVKSSTIKYTKKAKEFENIENIRNFERYMEAINKVDTFESYLFYEEEILMAAGMDPNDYDLESLQYSPNEIPHNFRESILNLKRDYIINNYEELNEYYRVYVGLPPIGREDLWTYVTEDEATLVGVDHKIPLHLMLDDDIFKLDKENIVEKYIKEYPDREYLKFLGYNKINLIQLRNANNFAMLRVAANVSDKTYSLFTTSYERCRTYVSSVLYNTSIAKTYPFYDEFMALACMFMTIQQFISLTLREGIKRDILDWEFIQAIYEMYHIPFIKSLPIEYHNIIVRNINRLLSIKSTDKVILDICSLLGYDDLSIYRYYLVRTHKLDENDVPLFFYKDIPNEDGTGTIRVIDPEKTYNYYFHPVNIRETDILGAISDAGVAKSYKEIIDEDPYWIDDMQTRNELYSREFNYIESKYISINLVYRMTKIIFEIIYSMRLILDRKDDTMDIKVKLPKFSPDKEFDLFHTVILLVVLLGKKNGFDMCTMEKPSLVSHFYGFNFDQADIDKIVNLLKSNPNLDKDTLYYLNNLSINSPDDANQLFKKIEGFNEFLVDKMYKTNNVEEYYLYRKIRDIMFQTKNNQAMYTMKNDIVAQSYREYLTDAEPLLVEKVDGMESTELEVAIDYVVNRLEDIMSNVTHLNILNDGNNPVFDAIATLIKFFKSNTVDLTGFNVVYLFNGKFDNMLKIIDEMRKFETELSFNDYILKIYGDSIAINSSLYLNSEKLTLSDYLHLDFATIYIYGQAVNMINLGDKITATETGVRLRSNTFTKDILKTGDTAMNFKDTLDMHDDVATHNELSIYSKTEDIVKVADRITGVDNRMSIEDDIRKIVNDYTAFTSETHHIDRVPINDSINKKFAEIDLRHKVNSNPFNIKDTLKTSSVDIKLNDIVQGNYSDSVSTNSVINLGSDKLTMVDNLQIVID